MSSSYTINQQLTFIRRLFNKIVQKYDSMSQMYHPEATRENIFQILAAVPAILWATLFCPMPYSLKLQL